MQVLLSLTRSPGDPPISIIARLPPSILPQLIPDSVKSDDEEDPRRVVAIRQGLHFLTTFHPELTSDDRFHEYFVRECVVPQLAARA